MTDWDSFLSSVVTNGIPCGINEALVTDPGAQARTLAGLPELTLGTIWLQDT